MPAPLPRSAEVDVDRLAGLFRHTTNSYKFLLVLALLDAVERGERCVEDRALAAGMLFHAWYPACFFRLSFGRQDQVVGIIEEIAGQVGSSDAVRPTAAGRAALREELLSIMEDAQLAARLLRYVQARLLRPFFAEEARGIKDHAVDGLVQRLSVEMFDKRRPLYRIVSPGGVEIHRAWMQYLHSHLAIVRGWVSWNWLTYMQARNPNVPAIATKLFAVEERDGVPSAQVEYWRRVIHGDPTISCLYSGRALDLRDGSVHIDHFVPWAFVAHDEAWNLAPAHREVNLKKGDRLPAEHYLERLVEVQTHGLVIARPLYTRGSWERLTESYIVQLGIPARTIWGGQVDPQQVRPVLDEALRDQIMPLLALARVQGFEPDWQWLG